VAQRGVVKVAKILVIEDEKAIRQGIVDLLEIEYHQALEAENGLIGLALARKEHPDLVICDVMMPQLDGYGVLRALREEQLTSSVPFLFLSAKATEKDLDYGLKLGATAYLTKPFGLTSLLQAIEQGLASKVS